MQNKICYVMCGPPCSGKSTYARSLKLPIVSCDIIREEIYGKNYKHNKYKETKVWSIFNDKLRNANSSFVVDNTNCRYTYIKAIKDAVKEDFKIEYVLFNKPFWLLLVRNYWRYFKTGKWIPINVIINMRKNFENEVKGKKLP